ncbi:MAG: alkaline phosphatase PhoX [Calditrichia bacterium]
MSMSRRHFIKTCGWVTVGFMGLQNLSCVSSQGDAVINKALIAEGYGPLLRDPNGILDLPEGFKYKIISRMGDKMSDGFFVPGAPDGMATFPGPNGLTLIIRNHEVNPGDSGAFGKEHELFKQIDPDRVYDAGGGVSPGCGGTTTIVFDTKKQEVVTEYLSLAGTVRNCAGGPTPWNSWVTCEETDDRKGSNGRVILEKDHGYNFEVPASAEIKLADPVPLIDMGRFRHEAIAVDPKSGIVYQTEDRDDGLIYRFIPNTPDKLADGGKLQALVIIDGPKETRNWGSAKDNIAVGTSYNVKWIDMDNVESPKDDLRDRGYDAGAARFARGEGMWRGEDGIYFACTNGGKAELGQIWRYKPGQMEGTPDEHKSPGRLDLFVEPNDSNLVENADNLTVSPWGDLIVCEDRKGDIVRLVGITPKGTLYTLANHHKNTEFAGVTISPDGTTMFVNMQGIGWTLAITGPWGSRMA